MKGRSFSLKPFPSECPPPHLKLTVSVERQAGMLSLSYFLHGRLEEIILPAPADEASRKFGLWKETCFEFFVGTKNSDRYWEFNLSPSGNWNVYSFASYRHGMQEEQAFRSLPFSVCRHADGLRLSLQFDPGNIVPAGQVLQIGVSAVIRAKGDHITHWALTHQGPQPDFHRREGFIVEV